MSRSSAQERRDDERPGETPAERADRNFGDLLQELRVGQTGVQVLFAFLLTIPFQSRFDQLGLDQRRTLVGTLVLAALATGCFMAPVAYHRILFRQGLKTEVVDSANLYARAGLGFLLLAIVTSLHLVVGVVLGRAEAFVVSGTIGVVLLLAWVVLPVVARRRAS